MLIYLPTWIPLFLLEALAVTSQHQPTEQIIIASSEQHQLDSDVHKVQYELKKAEIFPTVIDKFLPLFLLDAEWPSGERTELGNTVKVDDVQDEPTITVRRSHSSSSSGEKRSGVTYTIAITDPDAPSRDNPEWSEFCHFVAAGVDIPSSESAALRLSSLKDIMPYKPPSPPPKTGKHRYVFLLFAPANGTTDPLYLTKPEDRKHWGTGKARRGVRDWARKNGLKPVGE
ncbi:PEBP-like protein [Daldinia grandis]|nr:PEBP-like protein [Daldinia grandis]